MSTTADSTPIELSITQAFAPVITNIIQYRIKSNYGQNMYYIASEVHIKPIALLTGKKTIAPSDMRALELLGFIFQRVF